MIILNTVNDIIVNKEFNTIKEACDWLKSEFSDKEEAKE